VRLEELPLILLALGAAAAASFLLTPLAMRIARLSGAIDEPDAGRRIHSRPVPRAGGLAVVVAFVGVGVVAMLLIGSGRSAGPFPQLYVWGGDAVRRDELVALLGGSLLAAALGYIDDRWQIRARWQFVFQVVLAAVAVALGVTITFVANPLEFLGGFLDSSTITFAGLGAALVTGLWVIGMINSINFIDGLDGLSAGVALIAALTLGVISLTSGVGSYAPMVALLCAALAGALAGFLPWNFHPARVFIGTTGVMAVGYALAVLSIMGTAKVAVALLVLGVPIIDTFWIITRRLLNGRSPFTPDRGHIHHRLLDLGLTHRGAVLLIYAICAGLAVMSVVLAGGSGPLYAFLAVVIGSGLLLLLVTFRSGADAALEASSYPVDDTPATSGPAGRPGGPGPRPGDPDAQSRPPTPGGEPGRGR
jgi:UDP-GlcNAc:undecaprenyl-phosphate/decaprenyl-phosphate GlcNAc-1-phosphate transferase